MTNQIELWVIIEKYWNTFTSLRLLILAELKLRYRYRWIFNSFFNRSHLFCSQKEDRIARQDDGDDAGGNGGGGKDRRRGPWSSKSRTLTAPRRFSIQYRPWTWEGISRQEKHWRYWTWTRRSTGEFIKLMIWLDNHWSTYFFIIIVIIASTNTSRGSS